MDCHCALYNKLLILKKITKLYIYLAFIILISILKIMYLIILKLRKKKKHNIIHNCHNCYINIIIYNSCYKLVIYITIIVIILCNI